MIQDGGTKGNGQQSVPELSKIDNESTTVADILHCLKGCYETLHELLLNIDGIPEDIIDDCMCETLNRSCINTLNGGQSRLFFIQYRQWLPLMKTKLEEASTSSAKLKCINQRFKQTQSNGSCS